MCYVSVGLQVHDELQVYVGPQVCAGLRVYVGRCRNMLESVCVCVCACAYLQVHAGLQVSDC